MKCPVCSKEMAQITVGEIIVDGCDDCGGIWFDNKELKEIGEDSSISAEMDEFLENTESSFDEVKQYTCPKCGDIPLWKHPMNSRRVMADECPVCGGIWLNIDEFRTITKEYKEEQEIRDYIVLQERISREKCKEYFDEIARKENELREKYMSQIQAVMIEVESLERLRLMEENRVFIKDRIAEAVQRVDELDNLALEIKKAQEEEKELYQKMRNEHRTVELAERFNQCLEGHEADMRLMREKIKQMEKKININ